MLCRSLEIFEVRGSGLEGKIDIKKGLKFGVPLNFRLVSVYFGLNKCLKFSLGGLSKYRISFF